MNRFVYQAFFTRLRIGVVVTLLGLALSSCGGNDRSDAGNPPTSGVVEGELQSALSIQLTAQADVFGSVAIKAAGDNLIDLDAQWPTWSGVDSGITFDAESGRLLIPGDGTDIVLGVRRFDSVLTAGVSYTLNVESADPQSAAVLFLFNTNGTIVSAPGTDGLAVALAGNSFSFIAPDNIAGFYLQVQNQYQASAATSIGAELIEGNAGMNTGENLIDFTGDWADWSGGTTSVSGSDGSVTIPAPANGVGNVYGIKRFNTSLTAGAQYELAALTGSDPDTSVLLFLLNDAGQVVPFVAGDQSQTWLAAMVGESQRFEVPGGIASYVVQVQSPYKATEVSSVVPSLKLVNDQPEPPTAGTCNKLVDGDFELGSEGWLSSTFPTLTTAANNSTQALAFSNGWVSHEVPVDGSELAWRFTGFYKLTESDSEAYAGVDLLDADGTKISDVSTTLRYLEPDSDTVSEEGFIRFERNVTLPENARTLRVWIYSDTTITVDDLDLRVPGCRTPITGGSGVLSLIVPCINQPDLTDAGTIELTADFDNELYYVDGVKVLTMNRFSGFGRQDPTGPSIVADSALMLDDRESARESFVLLIETKGPKSYSRRVSENGRSSLVLSCFVRN